MENIMELQQIVYSVLKTQISFGVYRFGEQLPTMDEACRLFGVSIKTIRAAYQQLQQDGLIKISKNIGARVTSDYSSEDIRQNVREFFSCRRRSLIDLNHSTWLLLSEAQLTAFKKASSRLLEELEQLARSQNILSPYIMIRFFQMIYGSLHNDLLMRLVWQVSMFFLVPFLSIPENLKGLKPKYNPTLHRIDLCRKKDWDSLSAAIDAYEAQVSSALCLFYDNLGASSAPECQEAFQWSSYKKASQRCYSLCMEILSGISWGLYPAGAMLPSMNKMAEEKQVSVITIRRTLSLLGSIGVTKTVNGIGTYILPLGKVADNCDFTRPIVRKRLLDYVQSLQAFALTCRRITEITVSRLDDAGREQFKERLLLLRRRNRCELAPYGILELILHTAPQQAVRTVYDSLFQQLLWGYAIRNMRGTPEAQNGYYLPHLDALLAYLEQADASGFAAKLECLLHSEVTFAAEQLVRVGIQEASGVLY